MTNSIRPNDAASLLGNGEARTQNRQGSGERSPETGRSTALKRAWQKAAVERIRWLEAERREDAAQEEGIPVGKVRAPQESEGS